MTVGGDPQGVRSLHLAFGAAAGASYDQGNAFSGTWDAIGPANFQGGAAESWRTYVSQLRTANETMSKAFERVGSFLPRVATAIEDTQKAEKAEIEAADAVTKAQKALHDAENDLHTAQMAATAPLSAARSPFAVGPTPAEQAAVTAAEGKVKDAQRTLQLAQDKLRKAQHALHEADDHRKSVLRQLATLCHQEAAAIQAALPPGPAPSFAFAPGLLSVLQGAEHQLLEIPAIAGSWLAPDLLPGLKAAVAQDARTPGFLADISPLYRLATTPLSSFVTHPVKHSGGGGFWDWVGAGAVVVGSVGLIVVSAGTDTPFVLGADAGLAGADGAGGAVATGINITDLAGAAGVGGVVNESLSAADNVLHGQGIDPKGLWIAGTTGWVSAALPVGISSSFLRVAKFTNLPAVLATRATTGAVTGAGLNVASQEYLNHRVDWSTVGVAAGGGAYGGAWPGIGDIKTPSGWDLIPDNPVTRVVIPAHQGLLPGVVAASTDHAGPAKPRHP